MQGHYCIVRKNRSFSSFFTPQSNGFSYSKDQKWVLKSELWNYHYEETLAKPVQLTVSVNHISIKCQISQLPFIFKAIHWDWWTITIKKKKHTCGLQAVKNDRSKSVNTTCPSFWSKIFSGFRSLYIIPASQNTKKHHDSWIRRNTLLLLHAFKTSSMRMTMQAKRKEHVRLQPNGPNLLQTDKQNET